MQHVGDSPASWLLILASPFGKKEIPNHGLTSSSLQPDWRLGQLVASVASWRDTNICDVEEGDLADEIDRHI